MKKLLFLFLNSEFLFRIWLRLIVKVSNKVRRRSSDKLSFFFEKNGKTDELLAFSDTVVDFFVLTKEGMAMTIVNVRGRKEFSLKRVEVIEYYIEDEELKIRFNDYEGMTFVFQVTSLWCDSIALKKFFKEIFAAWYGETIFIKLD